MSHNSRNFLSQPLFKKASGGSNSRKKRTQSKSPIKETISSKAKKKVHKRKKSKVAITPTIHKKEFYTSAPKFGKPSNQREQAPFNFNQNENNTGLSIQK